MIGSDRLGGLPAANVAEQSQVTIRDEESLGHRARRGAIWATLNQLIIRLSNALVMLIVARIISPAELGVYALAYAIWIPLICTVGLGLDSAIARLDLDADKLAPTITTITLLSGLLTGGLMAFFARPLASLLGSPAAAVPIQILAISVAVSGIFVVPNALNRRAFKQQVLFRASFVGFLLSSATLLVLANLIPGAEAFAWSRVVQLGVAGLLVVASLGKRYRPGWHGQYVLPLLRLGMPAGFGALISQIILNIDYAIVGRRLPAGELGFYVLSYNISTSPSGVLDLAMREIVLPAFSSVRRDDGDLRSAVFRGGRMVSLVASPIGAFLCLFAWPVIDVVYGAKWLPAAPVLRILSLYGVLLVLTSMCDHILLASGKTTTLFVLQLSKLMTLVPALLIGLKLGGLIGVAIAHIIFLVVIALPVYSALMARLTGAGLVVLLRGAAPPFLAAVASTLTAFALTASIEQSALKLAIGLASGFLVYVAFAGRALLTLLPDSVGAKWPVRWILTWPILLRTGLSRQRKSS